MYSAPLFGGSEGDDAAAKKFERPRGRMRDTRVHHTSVEAQDVESSAGILEEGVQPSILAMATEPRADACSALATLTRLTFEGPRLRRLLWLLQLKLCPRARRESCIAFGVQRLFEACPEGASSTVVQPAAAPPALR